MDFDAESYYHVAYARHRIMNPLGTQRFLDAAAHCRLGPQSRVLDIGSGKGWASLLLVRETGCRATLVDPSPHWAAAAVALFEEHGLSGLAEVHQLDATGYPGADGAFDLVLCLGTTPIYGSFREAMEALLPMLAPGGMLLVGEPTIDTTPPKRYGNYLREWGWEVTSMRSVMKECATLGLELLMALRSTREEWDEYMNLQWLALIDHARTHPADAAAQGFLDWMRDEQEVYLRFQRHYMDWNLLLLRPE